MQDSGMATNGNSRDKVSVLRTLVFPQHVRPLAEQLLPQVGAHLDRPRELVLVQTLDGPASVDDRARHGKLIQALSLFPLHHRVESHAPGVLDELEAVHWVRAAARAHNTWLVSVGSISSSTTITYLPPKTPPCIWEATNPACCACPLYACFMATIFIALEYPASWHQTPATFGTPALSKPFQIMAAL